MRKSGTYRLGSILLLLAAFRSNAQETPDTAPANGPRRLDPAWHALVGATVHVQPGETKENATVVLRRGKIVSVGTKAAPAGARIWDAKGLHVYPGLIDAYVEVAAPAPDVKAPGVHWNPKVTPQRSALDGTVTIPRRRRGSSSDRRFARSTGTRFREY